MIRYITLALDFILVLILIASALMDEPNLIVTLAIIGLLAVVTSVFTWNEMR